SRTDRQFFSVAPISLTPGSTTGTVAFTWNAPAAAAVHIRLQSPTGPQITGDLPATGAVNIGDWGGEGTIFYLQDATSGDSSGPQNTIVSVTATADFVPAPPLAAP